MEFIMIIFTLLIGSTISTRGSLFSGFIASTFTPTDINGTDIDLNTIPEYADELKNREISTIFILGITGESFSLSLKQKMDLIQSWIKECHSRGISVIVNVGCHSIDDSISLAKYAASKGANAITSMTYTFFKPTNNDVLFKTIQAISETAPDTPYLYYHIPEITSNNINIVNLVVSCYENINNFEGIIYTDNKLGELTYLLDYVNSHIKHDKYLSILYGKEDQFDSLINIGIGSGVSSTFNYARKIYKNIHESYADKEFDKSREWQIKCDKFVRIYKQYTKDGYFPEKYLASILLDIDLGPPLLPLSDLPIDAFKEMNSTLTDIGFYSWLKYEQKKRDQKWLIIAGTIAGVIFMLIVSYIIWRRLKKEKLEVSLLEA